MEDDAAICRVLQLLLGQEGFSVISCFNAENIIKGKADIPDLYILDKQLSGIDGLEVCKYLKGNSDTKHIPVIMISASPKVEQLSREASADDFLEKPFKNKELIGIIKKHLGLPPS